MPGWNDFVAPKRLDSLFWHRIWRECGSPPTGVVAQLMRKTRGEYHKAIRFVKRNEDRIRAEKLAHSLMERKSRDFWRDIKRMNGSCSQVPNIIDSVIGDTEIANHFAGEYEKLFNSVSFDYNEMQTLLNELDIDCAACDPSLVCITTGDIIKAVKHVKPSKKDGFNLLTSDHFIKGSYSLYSHLANLFTMMIWHGYSPDGFNISTIQPLMKDKRKTANSSSNYRAIALCSPLAKVFDWLILSKFNDNFATEDLQFGFKPSCSTAKCTFTLNECVNYFKRNGSHVYVLLLDASKAFDKVNYVRLFNLLRERGIHPMFLKCLLYMYTNQRLNVSWNLRKSKYFQVSNGVKQGGVLSPTLFGIYVNDLLNRLKNSPFGCRVGHTYSGAFAYADDVALVAPSLYSLRKMCAICSQFATEYQLQFNPSKCKLVDTSGTGGFSFYFNGTAVDVVTKGIHLGHSIGVESSSTQIDMLVRDLTQRVNAIRSNFHSCSPEVKRRLFSTLCTSFYGLCQVDIDSNDFNRFLVAWRKSLRLLFNLPSRCHNVLIPLITLFDDILHQVAARYVRFINSCLQSNSFIRFFTRLIIQGSGSHVGNSYNFIISMFNWSSEFIVQCADVKYVTCVIHDHFYNFLDEISIQNACFIREILYDLYNVPPGLILQRFELQNLLLYLCTY